MTVNFYTDLSGPVGEGKCGVEKDDFAELKKQKRSSLDIGDLYADPRRSRAFLLHYQISGSVRPGVKKKVFDRM